MKNEESMSKEWESAYQSGNHNNSWPWSDLISLFYRFQKAEGGGKATSGQKFEKLSVFEYGCGTGNNYPFFKSISADYYGIEFSSTAVELLLEKFPELSNKIFQESFANFNPQPDSADLIVDRAALTHCEIGEIQVTLKTIFNHLKPGGLYIGIDWFSTLDSDFLNEKDGSLLKTSLRDLVNNVSGRFMSLGVVHFTDGEEIRNLFSNFELLHLSHKVVDDLISQKTLASWSLVARKSNEV
jgi:SAM-dependent methyltransferase